MIPAARSGHFSYIGIEDLRNLYKKEDLELEMIKTIYRKGCYEQRMAGAVCPGRGIPLWGFPAGCTDADV